MDSEKKPVEKIRFGSYEADLASGELRKGGIKLRLQPQPFQVLRLLIERPGEVVSRDELKQELWPDDTYVEFDLSLNTVIKKLRRALNDTPQHPRYIETLPRNGYRFIFPVEPIAAVRADELSAEAGAADGFVVYESPRSVVQPNRALRAVSGHADSQSDRSRAARSAFAGNAVVIPRKRRRLERIAAVLAAAAVVSLFALAYISESPSDGHVRRWSFSARSLASVALSPDGKYILFSTQTGAQPSLWIRPMDQESPRRVAGTEGATIGFWSPDSQFVAYAVDGQLEKISISGGEPVILCSLPNANANLFAGGSWSPDGENIVFSSGSRLHTVSASGGVSKPLFQDAAVRGSFQWPHFLPSSGGRRALVYSVSTNFRDSRMEVLDVDSGERRDLGPGSAPAYSPYGYLVYGPPNEGLRGLQALPFSLETLRPTGDAFYLNQDGIGASVSDAGDLAYWDDPRAVALHRLAWRERSTGRILESAGEAQFGMRNPAISPNGERALVSSAEAGDSNIYMHDLRRSTKLRLTLGEVQEAGARWSADSSNVVFWRQTGDETELVRKTANSGGSGEVLYKVKGAILSLDWSRDGRYLVLVQHTDEASREIRYIRTSELGEGAAALPYPARPARRAAPRLSPDSRYLAYEARESGRTEVFVGSFPDGAQLRRKISNAGGRSPRWRPDGRELYYLQGDSLMAVSVEHTSRGITLGRPQELFSSPDLRLGFAPSADSERVLTIVPVGETPLPAVHVVENWHDTVDQPVVEAGFGG